MDERKINFTVTRPQINFNVAKRPINFQVGTRQIHFHVGYACMNINTEIPGIPEGSEGLALVANEYGQPEWGAPIFHEDQEIDGGDI